MKRLFKTLFNVFMGLSLLIGIGYLLHDFIFLAIVPLFKHEFYTLTYFGLFTEVFAYLMIKICLMYFEDLFK